MDNLQWLTYIAQNFEALLYFLVFFFAVTESTLGASMLTPGSLTVMLIGATAAFSKSLNIFIILFLATLGAIVGDNISYFLGKRYGAILARKIGIKEEFLNEAKKFIKKHGPKSVALGRFVPFVKETIPFVAGTLEMDRNKFLLFNAIGAFGWMLMWPLAGYMFAKAVLSGNSFVVKAQIFIALLIFAYLFYFFARDFLSRYFKVDAGKYYKMLLSRRFIIFSSSIIFLYSTFILLAFAVLEHKKLIYLLDLLGFKLSMLGDLDEFYFFKYFTYTGDWHLILPVSIITTLFLFKKFYKEIVSYWVALLGSSFSTLLLKHIVGRPRPEHMKIAEDGLAFPSGHATLATAISFYLAFLVFMKMRGLKKYFAIATLILWAILIYISRIYLLVHYSSDIVGGIIVGVIFALLGVAVYMYLSENEKDNNKFSLMLKDKENQKELGGFSIKSPAFDDGSFIPEKYTCDGENTNPPLLLYNIPEGTKSIAIIMDDPDVPKEVREDMHFTHWVTFNISPSVNKIDEGAKVGKEGLNDAGSAGYIGPCPPIEFEPTEHRYFFKAYALDTMLDLPENTSQAELEEAMQGHIISKAVLMGKYDRAKKE